MALERLIPEDKSFKIDLAVSERETPQLRRIRLIRDFTLVKGLNVDFRDKFPRQIDPDSSAFYYRDRIYKYDIKTRIAEESAYGCAQFILDEEKVILRPLYPTEKYSVEQRDIVLRIFTKHLMETNQEFETIQ